MKKVGNNTLSKYRCEDCCFDYKEQRWIEKCETFCKTIHSCIARIICYSNKKLGAQK